jgi:hypothetical protein
MHTRTVIDQGGLFLIDGNKTKTEHIRLFKSELMRSFSSCHHNFNSRTELSADRLEVFCHRCPESKASLKMMARTQLVTGTRTQLVTGTRLLGCCCWHCCKTILRAIEHQYFLSRVELSDGLYKSGPGRCSVLKL